MNLRYFTIIFLTIVNFLSVYAQQDLKSNDIFLIAHRGGVVDSITPENSKRSIIKAAELGYWMIEVDLRRSKDNILITNHDNNFVRYYNIDKKVEDMTWKEISELKSNSGTDVQKFEDVLKLCHELGLNIMIDNKLKGFDPIICNQIIELLNKYNLRESALMIGTTASTEFFTGKIKLSCTRKQIEDNMKRADYSSNNYYFFGNPTKEDASWANQNNIMIVGVINSWAIPSEREEQTVKEIIQQLNTLNVRYIQLDSKYSTFLQY